MSESWDWNLKSLIELAKLVFDASVSSWSVFEQYFRAVPLSCNSAEVEAAISAKCEQLLLHYCWKLWAENQPGICQFSAELLGSCWTSTVSCDVKWEVTETWSDEVCHYFWKISQSAQFSWTVEVEARIVLHGITDLAILCKNDQFYKNDSFANMTKIL